MDLSYIRSLSEKFPGGIRGLAMAIGMSEPNLHRCIKVNKMQAGDLEKVAKALGVDISVFFDENNNNNPHKVVTRGNFSPASENGNASVVVGDAALALEVQHLRDKLADKEEIIQLLKQQIPDKPNS